MENELLVMQKYPYSYKNQIPEFVLTLLTAKESILFFTHPSVKIEKGVSSFFLVDGKKSIRFEKECGNTGISVVKYLPYSETFGTGDIIGRFMLWFLLISVPVYILYVFYIRRSVHRPIVELQRAFQEISRGNLNVRLQESHTVSDFLQLNISFNSMAEQLKNVKQSEMQAKQFNAEMELKHLQAQINPHFLYNAFYTLKYQIQSGCWDTAELMTEYLGRFFRHITRTAKTEVPLSEEYAHVLCYLGIQKIRFGDTLLLETESLRKEDESILVPRLILQPLVENIFQYGRCTLENQPTVIRMRFHRAGDMLYVSICDNGNTLSSETLRRMQTQLMLHDIHEETTGIINIHRRLKLYFGEKSGITLLRSEMGGLCVQLVMDTPMSKKGE